jgi:hypothetical protein
LCYGDRVDGKRLALLGNTTQDEGTSFDGLNEAALEFGFRLEFKAYRDVTVAYLAMRETLHGGVPILMCVDYDHEKAEYTHWIAAIRGTSRHVWVCDPARNEGEVLRKRTWRQLLRRLHWGLPDELRFEVYPVVPA